MKGSGSKKRVFSSGSESDSKTPAKNNQRKKVNTNKTSDPSETMGKSSDDNRNGQVDNNLERNLMSSGMKRKNLDGSFADESMREEDEYDDVNEKLNRSNKRLITKTGVFHSPTVTPLLRKSLPSTTNAGRLSPSHLKEHYAFCIKLSASNKINNKNAFGLHLIDYMSELINKNPEGQVNFKMASSALDAGAKIYSHRVDCVHAEAQKVASGLVMALDDKAHPVTHDVSDVENEQSQPDQPRSKKRRTHKRNIVNIAQNVDSLNYNKLETNISIDPLFHQLSTAFDMGNVNGLLMYNLKLNHQAELMLDSDLKYHVLDTNDTPDSCQSLNVSNILTYFHDTYKSSATICPKFCEFEFSDRDSVRDATTHATRDVHSSKHSSEHDPKDGTRDTGVRGVQIDYDHGFTFDIDAEVQNVQDHDDCPNHDYLDENYISNESDNESEEQINELAHKSNILAKTVQMVNINELTNLLSDKPSDYSYFNKGLLPKAWAGANNFKKFNFFSRDKRPVTDKTRKQRKQFQEINFFMTQLSDDMDKVGKNNLKLKVATLEKWQQNVDNIQLPIDYGYDIKHLARSFLKPQLTFRSAKNSDNIPNTHFTHNSDHNHSFDTPAPDFNNYDDDDNDNDDVFNSDTPVNAPTSEINTENFAYFGDNLVEGPDDINLINLPYAKVAKKMDVKKLKKAIWDVLTIDQSESIPTTTPVKKVNSKVNFTHLVQTLPKKITPQMANNLSAPIAFVTLLHLCNERGLQLVGCENFTDFVIEQPHN